MSTLQTYSFAITQADVGPYSAGAVTWTNIPVVGEGTVEYTIQRAEVQDGEGKILNVWFHSQRAKVTLRMKRFAFRILEIITGSPVSSAQGTDMIYFGRDEELSAPWVRLRLQQKAVDTAGTEGYFEVIIFKAQGTLPAITMRETTAGDYTVTFDALLSSVDAAGNTIPDALFAVKALKSSLT